MTYLTGAFRSHYHPEDKFVERASDPLMAAPVPATAQQWHECVQLAAAGNPMARFIVGIGRAENAKKLAAAEGTPIPAWAQEILAPLEDDENENLDEVMAALSRAIS